MFEVAQRVVMVMVNFKLARVRLKSTLFSFISWRTGTAHEVRGDEFASPTRCGIAQSDGRVLASEWCWWGCAGKLLACDMDMKREWSNAHKASVWELLLTRGDRYRLINR